MSRRFMVIRKAPCCGDEYWIGRTVFEAKEIVTDDITCYCGKKFENVLVAKVSDGTGFPVSLIKWLDDPDEEIISHDAIQEIEDKLKV
jgi:hypothetical protein